MSLRHLLDAVLSRLESAFERAGRSGGAEDDTARGEFISQLIIERGPARAEAEAGTRRDGTRLG